MEKSLFNSDKLDSFADALLCSPSIYIWRYSYDGSLSETNCPEHVYHRIFEHTGCLSYMINGAAERTPLILGAALGILWAAVYEWEEDALKWCYVIGPVFHNEVSNELLSDAIRRYHIDPSWRPAFVRAMHGIPAASSILFFQYAVMLHCIVTGEKLSRSDLRFQHHEETDRGMISVPHSNRHLTYQAEQALLQLIRDGDLNYRGAMEKAGLISSGVGISTNDPVKRAILSASNFTALCTRAAIEGGLTPDTAYTVGDSYIQSLTECRTIVDVRTVNHTMYEDFIQRVHRQRTNPKYSQQIHACAAYIEAHLDEDLTLEKLAHEVGYSEYHLSRKFKEETGHNIRDYIKFARVERAKLLLSTTDMSIRDIAEHLRFSAPSHFAKVFREVTGQLPQQYRKETYK
ncbi:MAG: helix-turn-helix transcriptional regulator [Firmicutes bacterium]|nr:helix-turn-helix transcriptional regulator [Bacillota bacterium]